MGSGAETVLTGAGVGPGPSPVGAKPPGPGWEGTPGNWLICRLTGLFPQGFKPVFTVRHVLFTCQRNSLKSFCFSLALGAKNSKLGGLFPSPAGALGFCVSLSLCRFQACWKSRFRCGTHEPTPTPQGPCEGSGF